MSRPSLASLFGEKIRVEDLAHLPSMRNHIGQCHVNADLTSLSWLTFPPFSTGYHTGVLRIDGHIGAAEAFEWQPWGVKRSAAFDELVVTTDTRLIPGRPIVVWQIAVTNGSGHRRSVDLSQELNSMSTRSDGDWGWLYGTPWNSGHFYDYFSTEAIRGQVLDRDPDQSRLIPGEPRFVRLGAPKPPGIQRDEEGAAMLLETTLPDHTTSDRQRVQLPGASSTLLELTLSSHGSSVKLIDAPVELTAASQERMAAVTLHVGSDLSARFRLSEPSTSGVLLTHGNHPDSLQLGFDDGYPWLTIGGERVESSRHLKSGVHTINVRLQSSGAVLEVNGERVGQTAPWWESRRWNAESSDHSVTIKDVASDAISTFIVPGADGSVNSDASRGHANWRFSLEPSETRHVYFSLEIGVEGDSPRSLSESDIEELFLFARSDWERIWQDAFTPGNSEFSGHLPTLEADSELEKTYYTAALQAIYMRNTGVSPIGSVYLTGGPRLGPTTTFYWDIVEWSRTIALLDPVALRAWILAALSVDYQSSLAFDTKNLLPIGNYYSANDYSLYRTVEHYVGITGDLTLLDEQPGGLSVLLHLREMALGVEKKRAKFGDKILADFGSDPWELLECVPNYRHVVVGFNAAYARMLHSFGSLQHHLGETDPYDFQALSKRTAEAVARQYAGGGRWTVSFPDHDEVIGHCLDFQLVAAEIPEYLTDSVKQEMVEFVSAHLIDGDWMRALDPEDPIAPYSDRPDHGAAGAFGAWPPDTCYGLMQLGRTDIALRLLRRLPHAASGALWGQAMESIGGGRYQVAERGVSNRETGAAVAVVDTIVAGLFGIKGDFYSLERRQGTVSTLGARLVNVRAIGFDLANPAMEARGPSDEVRSIQ